MSQIVDGAEANVERATDQQLVELASRGDHDAFAALVESRIGQAVRTASAILGNEADAHPSHGRMTGRRGRAS